jgi:hypothetical protein
MPVNHPQDFWPIEPVGLQIADEADVGASRLPSVLPWPASGSGMQLA